MYTSYIVGKGYGPQKDKGAYFRYKLIDDSEQFPLFNRIETGLDINFHKI